MRLLFFGNPVKSVITGLLIVLLTLASPVTAINITVTGTLENWDLAPGIVNENATAIHLNVSPVSTGWTVTVADALEGGKSSNSAGRMLEYNAGSGWVNGGSVLAENLTVIGESVPGVLGSTAILGPTGKLIESGSGTAEKRMIITLRQPVATIDHRLTNGNMYRVVVTFTGTEL
jgi:hypothetical protein